ncbi:MAG: helix-turn-helix domain-containing protein [Ancrocorticia sp.]|nr:helix-turn-helix domain-containing protein [Ancrocorticia sp.]
MALQKMHKSGETEYLTATQAAAMLPDTSSATVLRWARTGKIPVVELPGGRKFFLESDIERILTPTTESADEAQARNEAGSNDSADHPLPGFEEMGQ